MSADIVNEDYAITITPGGAWAPGNPTYTIFKCTKLKVNTKFALIWHILWQLMNLDCVLAGYTLSNGAGMIMPTGIKCFTNTDNPIRKGDNGKCNGVFVPIAGGPNVLCTCQYEITNAGQNKAKCN